MNIIGVNPLSADFDHLTVN